MAEPTKQDVEDIVSAVNRDHAAAQSDAPSAERLRFAKWKMEAIVARLRAKNHMAYALEQGDAEKILLSIEAIEARAETAESALVEAKKLAIQECAQKCEAAAEEVKKLKHTDALQGFGTLGAYAALIAFAGKLRELTVAAEPPK